MFVPVKEEHRTAFFGEDIYIDFPPGNVGEVVFRPRTNRSAEVVLLRAGTVVNPRGRINSLGHLVLEDVQEEDEGLYVIRNASDPGTAQRLLLIVRGERPPEVGSCQSVSQSGQTSSTKNGTIP